MSDPQFSSTDILSKDHPPDKKPKSDKASLSSNEFDPTALVVEKSGNNSVLAEGKPESCGAAMRAGVQTGDRIIKVNGTLVTHSNHTEVVKLIKGSYVALTVLGRPPGLAQIPLPEAEPDILGVSLSSPNSPATERPYSPQDRLSPFQPSWPATPESHCPKELSYPSPKSTPRNSFNSCHSPETEDTTDLDSLSPPALSSPSSSRVISQIIGAEDDYFGRDQEQTNGQCDSFNSIEQLKSRPAHLAAFLHYVISQFEPAPVLCYLYTELYKQTNSKETRRVFMDLHTFFMDRGAVPVPESVSSDLRWRGEVHTAEINRQHVQTLQDSLLADVEKHLEDFQKRNMGLTVAEAELARLDQERVRDRVTLERERSYAENIISKIDDVLTTQTTEEDKSTIQFVIYTYMKHLGVRVKEPRNLESKRGLNRLFPKMKPQKQLSQPTLGAVELMDSSRLRGSQSSEGPELTHSLSVSSPSNTTYSVEANRDADIDVQSEDDQGTDSELHNWQQLVGREVLAGLRPQEIKRQEVINELFYTERAHVGMLKVLDDVFYQRLSKDAILPPADIKNIFTNLEEVLQLHSILEQMTAIRKRNDLLVIDLRGDDLLSWFSGAEEEKIKQAVGTFCSNQPFALEIIKTKQKKDSRFTSFIQEAESNRQCRRLQLKDIIPVEMLRLTKYPLLLDNIVRYTDDPVEKHKVKQAADCCRKILSHVNQALKESEDKQKLEDYQRRLDLSSLKQTDNPVILELKNLDLTKKTLIHEGPLSWKMNKDKTILYTLLLEDILVLLQKQDERLILKCHSKILAGTPDTKHTFSPIIKLNTVLVRSVATNKSFFVLSMSDNVAQIYELMAPTVSDQKWQTLISQRADTMKVKPHSIIPLPQTGERDGVEIITAGVSRLSRERDRTSTGSTQSTKESGPASRSTLQGSLPASNPFEEGKADVEEEEGFLDPELSCEVSEVDREGDSFDVFPSRADEALKTAALKQVLVNQLMSQEAAQQTKRSTGVRLLRTTSLRTPTDNRAKVMVHNGSEKSSSKTEDLAQDLGSGDTGFFDSPEDYLDGYGGQGESSTDGDILASAEGKQLRTSQGCAADSGINLRFSSTSQFGSLSTFSRQVLSHLRHLQTSLGYLKEVETKYNNLIRQRTDRPSTDTDGNKLR
uniref:Rho guanine nucleotide exchange factor 12 n=1 Tax=Poecilia latipinna TaxID=48699 RepID=A0A3B3VQD2_9TELE